MTKTGVPHLPGIKLLFKEPSTTGDPLLSSRKRKKCLSTQYLCNALGKFLELLKSYSVIKFTLKAHIARF